VSDRAWGLLGGTGFRDSNRILGGMAQRAKLFKSRGSQAVRLPPEFQFDDQEEVLIYRQGNRIVLEPVRRSWSPEFLALAGSEPDFSCLDEPPAVDPGPELE